MSREVSEFPAPSAAGESVECRRFLDALGGFTTLRAIKLFRLALHPPPPVPVLPCLDHEAMLHEEVAPHAAAYVEDANGHLHEVVVVPDERRITVDLASTIGERSDHAHEQLLTRLGAAFPAYRVKVHGPSWLKGERRVAKACRAQVSLRDVLTGPDLDKTKVAVDRLQTISSLMEKESRVASWAARTVMTPLIAVAGFVTYQVLGALDLGPGLAWVSGLRYVVIGLLGAYFLYYGLKAVQLTEMANRVWKRSAEYGLILSERRRLSRERPT
jgi:hypothetical protein